MYIQILKIFKIFQSKTRSLGCRTVFLRKKMVILQDLARRMVIFQDSCNTLVILQDEWLSFKILARQMVILQDLARFWKKILQDDVSSCKILQDSCRVLQDNHSDPTREALNHFCMLKCTH